MTSKTEAFGFVGAAGASTGFLTSPLIVKILVFSGALVVKVIVLVNLPILLVAYFTPIEADSPGEIGAFGQVGTVHPQLPLALEMIKGALPLLVRTNSLLPSALCSIRP